MFDFCHMEFANKHVANLNFCYGSFHVFFLFYYLLMNVHRQYFNTKFSTGFDPVQSEEKRQGSVKTAAIYHINDFE
jgi:hypothetical protein